MVPLFQPGCVLMFTADHTSSPKKRKATGPQQAAPPPTSQPQYTSPPFSQTGSSVSNTPSSRRRGHSRQRSDLSARGLDSYGRPLSRHRQEGGFTSQGLTSPPHAHVPEQQHQQSQASTEPRRRSGGSHPVSSLLEQSDSRPQQSQSQQQAQQFQRDPQYSAGPEMRHESQRTSPEEGNGNSISRRASLIKRDEGRD